MPQERLLRFSPKALGWESEECTSEYAICAALWLSNPTVPVRKFMRLSH
jgi:hypothetical protein